MKKLIDGIIKFKSEVSEEQLEQFSKLALGQKPDALFVACSDSRVVPNLFASTDPGDLFVVRNVGNIIPPISDNESADDSEAAAIEFALKSLKINDIIVCGHSECGAMKAVLDESAVASYKYLSKWIKYGVESKKLLEKKRDILSDELSELNALSQVNVLQQLEHLKTYPMVSEKINSGELKLHVWWFDITTASVYIFNDTNSKFELLK